MNESQIYNPREKHNGNIDFVSWSKAINIHDMGFKGIHGSVYVQSIPLERRRECLEKLPEYVGQNFNIIHNHISSLNFCPKKVGGNFLCYNEGMIKLGASYPIEITGDLIMSALVERDDGLKTTRIMNNITNIGKIYVEGAVVGFDVKSFLGNYPDENAILNAIELLSSCKNSDTYKEGLTLLRNKALNVESDSDTTSPQPSHRRRF